MKPTEIKEGKLYRNRGKGKTTRRVLVIGDAYRPSDWFSTSEPPNEPGVLYEEKKGKQRRLYLSSFAAWAGSCIDEIPL